MPTTVVHPTSEDTRVYECMLLLSTALTEAQKKDALQSIEDLFTERGGTLLHASEWGRRGLAYPIGRCTEGQYVILLFELKPDAVREISALLLLEKAVLRHLLVRVSPHYEVIDYRKRLQEWFEEREREEQNRAREREEQMKKRIVKRAVRKDAPVEKAEQREEEVSTEELGKKIEELVSDEDLNL